MYDIDNAMRMVAELFYEKRMLEEQIQNLTAENQKLKAEKNGYEQHEVSGVLVPEEIENG